MGAREALAPYHRKRDFSKTPEPRSGGGAKIIDLTELLQRSLRKGGKAAKTSDADEEDEAPAHSTKSKPAAKSSAKAGKATKTPARKTAASKAPAKVPAKRRAA